MAKQTFQIGDQVKFTTKFLKNTGLAQKDNKVCKITGFDYDWAILDELLHDYEEAFTKEELAQDPTLKYRRVATQNLQKV